MKKLALMAAAAMLLTAGFTTQARADMQSVWNWLPKSEAAKADRNDDSLPVVRTNANTAMNVKNTTYTNTRLNRAASAEADNDTAVSYQAHVPARMPKQWQKQDEKTFNN